MKHRLIAAATIAGCSLVAVVVGCSTQKLSEATGEVGLMPDALMGSADAQPTMPGSDAPLAGSDAGPPPPSGGPYDITVDDPGEFGDAEWGPATACTSHLGDFGSAPMNCNPAGDAPFKITLARIEKQTAKQTKKLDINVSLQVGPDALNVKPVFKKSDAITTEFSTQSTNSVVFTGTAPLNEIVVDKHVAKYPGKAECTTEVQTAKVKIKYGQINEGFSIGSKVEGKIFAIAKSFIPDINVAKDWEWKNETELDFKVTVERSKSIDIAVGDNIMQRCLDEVWGPAQGAALATALININANWEYKITLTQKNQCTCFQDVDRMAICRLSSLTSDGWGWVGWGQFDERIFIWRGNPTTSVEVSGPMRGTFYREDLAGCEGYSGTQRAKDDLKTECLYKSADWATTDEEKNSCSKFNYSRDGFNYVFKYKRDTYACDEIEKSNVKCAVRAN